MKRILENRIPALLVTLSLTVTVAALTAADCLADDYVGSLPYIPYASARMEERTVSVDILFSIADMDIRPQQTYLIVPMIVSEDFAQEVELTPLYIDGRIRSRAERREAVLGGREPRPENAVSLTAGNKVESYRYRDEIPYARWMLGSSLRVRIKATGCADCRILEDTAVLCHRAVEEYIPSWSTPEYMLSPRLKDKDRERKTGLSVTFPINSSEISPGHGDNRESLREMVSCLLDVDTSGLYSGKVLEITGYASPDGAYGLNEKLAEDRAESMADYLVREAGVPDSLIRVSSVAEDWDGMAAAVAQHPELKVDAGLRDIISVCREGGDADSCEVILKKDARRYDMLRKDVLGGLRRIEYTLKYRVKDFSVEEASGLWKTHPDMLSIAEMYAVVEHYGTETDEGLEVLRCAALTYPDDIAASHNAAMALAKAGRHDEAIRLLEGTEDPVLLNTLGTVLAGAEEYGAAMAAFTKSADMGNEDAKTNVSGLEKVMEQL